MRGEETVKVLIKCLRKIADGEGFTHEGPAIVGDLWGACGRRGCEQLAGMLWCPELPQSSLLESLSWAPWRTESP